jgi:hypothetical protein
MGKNFLKCSKIFKSPLLWAALLIIIVVLYFMMNTEGFSPRDDGTYNQKDLDEWRRKNNERLYGTTTAPIATSSPAKKGPKGKKKKKRK